MSWVSDEPPFFSYVPSCACLVCWPKYAHPLPCTITNNMGWKVCFLKSTICWSLGRREIVLRAESIIICHVWKLTARRTDTLFADWFIITCTHTETHTSSVLPHNTYVKKRARKIWGCPALPAEESGGLECVSHIHKKSLCVLVSNQQKLETERELLMEKCSKGCGMGVSLS